MNIVIYHVCVIYYFKVNVGLKRTNWPNSANAVVYVLIFSVLQLLNQLPMSMTMIVLVFFADEGNCKALENISFFNQFFAIDH